MPAFRKRIFNSLAEITNQLAALTDKMNVLYSDEDNDSTPDIIQKVNKNTISIAENKTDIAANTSAIEANAEADREHIASSLGYEELGSEDTTNESGISIQLTTNED